MRERIIAFPGVHCVTLARCHATNDIRAVGKHLRCVEGSFAAGNALDDDLGILVDQNAHSELSFVG